MMQGSLAVRLQALRARGGLTLTEASEQLGINRHTLSRLESGTQKPYGPTLKKLATGYGVPVEELLEEPVLSGKAEARPSEFVFKAHDFDLGWALSAPEDEFKQ